MELENKDTLKYRELMAYDFGDLETPKTRLKSGFFEFQISPTASLWELF